MGRAPGMVVAEASGADRHWRAGAFAAPREPAAHNRAAYGVFDNRDAPLADLPGGTPPARLRLATRLRGRLAGRRAPLHPGAGAHLAFRAGGRRFCYVYIRKNGCTGFKRFLGPLAGGSSDGPEIQRLLANLQVSFAHELVGTRRILVLRDPVARACSLFRNKLVQRSGSADIERNIQELTGQRAGSLCFRDFVQRYLGAFLHADSAAIDPHCAPQAAHLWPIRYDTVLRLDDLSRLAPQLFATAHAERIFAGRANSSGRLDEVAGADARPAADLAETHARHGVLPADESLATPDLAGRIRELYRADERLLAMAFAGCSPW